MGAAKKGARRARWPPRSVVVLNCFVCGGRFVGAIGELCWALRAEPLTFEDLPLHRLIGLSDR